MIGVSALQMNDFLRKVDLKLEPRLSDLLRIPNGIQGAGMAWESSRCFLPQKILDDALLWEALGTALIPVALLILLACLECCEKGFRKCCPSKKNAENAPRAPEENLVSPCCCCCCPTPEILLPSPDDQYAAVVGESIRPVVGALADYPDEKQSDRCVPVSDEIDRLQIDTPNGYLKWIGTLASIYLLYPSLTTQAFSLLSVTWYGQDCRMDSDLATECNFDLRYPLACAILIGYVVGYPVLVMVLASRAPNLVQFLLKGFEYREWFVAVTLRKVLISFTLAIAHQAQVQLALVAIILTFALVFHARVLPFQGSAKQKFVLNLAEGMSLSSSICLFVAGSLYFQPDADEHSEMLSNLSIALFTLLAGLICGCSGVATH